MPDTPQDSPSAPTEGVEPVSEVGQILDELATSIHNLRPGDVGSMDRVLVPIWKAEAAIERLIVEARIDEVKRMRTHNLNTTVSYLTGRLTELNQIKGESNG